MALQGHTTFTILGSFISIVLIWIFTAFIQPLTIKNYVDYITNEINEAPKPGPTPIPGPVTPIPGPVTPIPTPEDFNPGNIPDEFNPDSENFHNGQTVQIPEKRYTVTRSQLAAASKPLEVKIVGPLRAELGDKIYLHLEESTPDVVNREWAVFPDDTGLDFTDNKKKANFVNHEGVYTFYVCITDAHHNLAHAFWTVQIGRPKMTDSDDEDVSYQESKPNKQADMAASPPDPTEIIAGYLALVPARSLKNRLHASTAIRMIAGSYAGGLLQGNPIGLIKTACRAQLNGDFVNWEPFLNNLIQFLSSIQYQSPAQLVSALNNTAVIIETGLGSHS